MKDYILGIDLSTSKEKMIIDIGGKTSEIAIIAHGEIVYGKTIRIGDDNFNIDIKKYLLKQHNVTISRDDVERIKIELGLSEDAQPNGKDAKPICVYGKDLLTKMPIQISVSNKEVAFALDKSIVRIETAIMQALENIASEIHVDIVKSGIYITGGSSRLRGLDERIYLKTGIKEIQRE